MQVPSMSPCGRGQGPLLQPNPTLPTYHKRIKWPVKPTSHRDRDIHDTHVNIGLGWESEDYKSGL